MEERNENKNILNQITCLRKEFDDLKEAIPTQNVVLAGELAEVKVLLKAVLAEKKSHDTAQQAFPLETDAALQNLEDNISDENSNNLIAMIKKITARGGLCKSLHNLIGPEIIKNYNWDGIQNKKAFKSYKRVNDLLYRAVIDVEGCKENFVKAMKRGFKNEKNKMYKATHTTKKNLMM